MRINNFIDNNYNPNFQSRNAEIRFADDIVRKVNNEFLRLSPSRVDDFKSLWSVRRSFVFLNGLADKVRNMRVQKYEDYANAQTFSQKLSAITSAVKNYKVGNCGESAQLSEIAARVNGIKDCFCVEVYGNGGHDLDHTVLMVKNHGKPYIIDAWLGFADYLPEAAKRYQKDFRRHFRFGDCIGEKVNFDKRASNDPTGAIFAENYSEEELRKLYPELIVKK